MINTIELEKIIEGIELETDELRALLNLKSGEIIVISDEDFDIAEADTPIEELPVWQQENVKMALEVLEEDYFIPLPSRFDIDEYSIMEEFCFEIKNNKIREIIEGAIKGSGAFRRFKNKIREFDLEEMWYKYHNNEIKNIAIEWCEENGISYK